MDLSMILKPEFQNLSHLGASKVSKIKQAIWVSVSEAATIGGVNDKTIRRAIKLDPKLQYRIVKNRYQIEVSSLIYFLNKNTKLANKFKDFGFGQYVKEWDI